MKTNENSRMMYEEKRKLYCEPCAQARFGNTPVDEYGQRIATVMVWNAKEGCHDCHREWWRAADEADEK